MTTLLWKDFRLIRAPIIAAMLLMLGSYLLAGTAWWHDEIDVGFGGWGALADAAWLGLCCTAFMAAVITAVLFDGERRDGTAIFLATLPVPRWKTALSKLTVGAVVVGTLWLANVLVRLMPGNFNQIHESVPTVLTDIASPTAAALMLFGSALLLAMFVSSPTIAASLACGVLYVCVLIFHLLPGALRLRFPPFTQARTEDLFDVVLLAIGAAAFLIGLACYLWRVEP